MTNEERKAALEAIIYAAERGGQLVDGGGFVGGVNDGFQGGFSFFVGHLVLRSLIKKLATTFGQRDY